MKKKVKEISTKKVKNNPKKNRKKTKKIMGRAEFLFNVISLLILIGIGIYFGGRSLYYYSLHTKASSKEAGTLVEKVLEMNEPTQKENGFHQLEDGYLFVGQVENNYVLFSNRLFRILRINENHSMKLVTEDNQTILTLGDVDTYEGSNLEIWLNKEEQIEQSGVFYRSLTDAYNNLVETKYCEGTLENNQVTCAGKKKKAYVTLLSVDDYLEAHGNNSFLNNGKYTWLLGKQEDAFLYLSEDGKIGKSSLDEGYGVRAVITLDARMRYVSGDGTKENPYRVQENNPTKVGSYVQLGNDVYRGYREDDNLLYLALDQYAMQDNQELVTHYNVLTTQFDPRTNTNIAYYLNNTYLFQLPYRDYLQDFQVYTGEISRETGMTYLNQYTNFETVKIGLLSIADIKTNPLLTDYYLSNTTSSVGDSAYIYDAAGLLREGDVIEPKHFIPTVAILKSAIQSGDGTKENPYKVEG